MKRAVVLAVLAVAVASSALATPLVGRGAGTLKPMQFLGEVDFGYTQTGQKYNWTDSKWDALADTLKTSTISAAVIAGFAPTKNWELLVHAPLSSRSQGAKDAFGVGDIELHTRYGIIAGKLAPVKLTAVAAAAFPTADKNVAPKLGDGKWAGAVGLLVTSKPLGKSIVHARAAYWLNGNTNDTTKAGNMFEYVAKFDHDFTKKFQLWASLVGTMQARTEINGTAKEKTEQDRHVAQLGLVIKPVPVLSIRPKAGVPLAFISKGGSIAPFSAGLDFWVTLP